MKYLPIYLLCMTFLLKASAYSDEELLAWYEEASALARTDAAYIDANDLRERPAIVSYLASAGAVLAKEAPEVYKLGVKGINAATMMSRDGQACPPWEPLLTTVLGGVDAPTPIIYEAELYGLFVRGHSAAKTLMDRFIGIEGITRQLSALKLED